MTDRAATRRRRLLALGLTAAVVLSWSLPLLWLVSSTFQRGSDILVGEFTVVPENPTLDNWATVLDSGGRAGDLVVAFVNSVIVAALATTITLVVCSPAAFAFCRLRFRGRRALFTALLISLMVPGEVLLVPLFEQFQRLGLLDTYAALVLPHVVSVFGVFLLRQFMRDISVDLVEAIRMDGGGWWRVYWHVALPSTRSAMTVLGVFVFLGAWNDFVWPLVAVSSPEMRTLPLALVTFRDAYGASDYGVLLAAVALAVVPPTAFFLLARRHIAASLGRSTPVG